MIQIISCMLGANKNIVFFLVYDGWCVCITNGCHGNAGKIIFVA